MSDKKLITPTEIAELAGRSLPAVSNWMKRFDDFPAGRTVPGSKRLRYDRDEVIAWLEGRQLSQATSREHAALLSIDRDLRRDFLGTLFVVLHSIPSREKSSVQQVMEKYRELASSKHDGVVNFDLESVPDVVADLVPRYKGLSDRELADILSAMEEGSSNRSTGEYATPDVLVDFLAALAPTDAVTVLDLASGQGRILEHFAAKGIGTSHRGSDINPSSIIQARQSAALRGLNIRYTVASVLDSHETSLASLIVADPPLSVRSSREELENRAWPFGRPSTQDITSAFLQRAVESLEPGGRALVLSAASLLSRGGELSELRWRLIHAGVVRGIVALPSKLRTNTAIPLALWILGTPDKAVEEVVMADASLSSANDLTPDGPVVRAILAELNHDALNQDDTYATTVSIRDLLTRDVDLRPNAWVAKKRDLIEPQEQLKLAQSAMTAVEALVGDMPFSGSHLAIGDLEPHLVSLQELHDRGSLKLVRAPMARASEEGSGDPVLDVRVLLGDRDRATARRLLDPSAIGLVIEPGDIVVAAGPRGVTALVWQESGWVAGTGIQVIRVRDNSVNSQFLAAAVQHPRNLAHVDAGALRVQVNIRSFEVPDLQLDEQERLAILLSALDQAESELQSRLSRLSESRTDIVHAVGSGTLSVPKRRKA
jgi:methylase of polypeptide subunit release factors